ncbi:hypothetical protein NKH77_48465 [Streptomyces sp. M19]
MRERGLRELRHGLRAEGEAPRHPDVPPPGDPRAEAVRGLEGVEAAALDPLAAAEGAVDGRRAASSSWPLPSSTRSTNSARAVSTPFWMAMPNCPESGRENSGI